MRRKGSRRGREAVGAKALQLREVVAVEHFSGDQPAGAGPIDEHDRGSATGSMRRPRSADDAGADDDHIGRWRSTHPGHMFPAVTTLYGAAMEPTREQAEAAILDLLARRDPGKTICPSEAARVLGGDEGFRPLMPLVRDAARALVTAGRVEVTQSGQPVDLDAARGPIRLRTPLRDP